MYLLILKHVISLMDPKLFKSEIFSINFFPRRSIRTPITTQICNSSLMSTNPGDNLHLVGNGRLKSNTIIVLIHEDNGDTIVARKNHRWEFTTIVRLPRVLGRDFFLKGKRAEGERKMEGRGGEVENHEGERRGLRCVSREFATKYQKSIQLCN